MCCVPRVMPTSFDVSSDVCTSRRGFQEYRCDTVVLNSRVLHKRTTSTNMNPSNKHTTSRLLSVLMVLLGNHLTFRMRAHGPWRAILRLLRDAPVPPPHRLAYRVIHGQRVARSRPSPNTIHRCDCLRDASSSCNWKQAPAIPERFSLNKR